MNRRTIITIAALLALAALAFVVLAISGVIGGPPLSGQTRHDLGVIPLLLDGKGSATHTFTLTNTAAEPVRIIASKASCGCTSLNLEDNTAIPPGESIDIDAVMTLNSPIQKHVRLTLHLGKHGDLVLNLSGKGRRADPLYVRRSPIELMDDKTQLNLYYESDSNTPPPQPGLTVPPGFAITIGEWKTERLVDKTHGRPALYAAPMAIEKLDNASDDAVVTLTTEGHQANIPIK